MKIANLAKSLLSGLAAGIGHAAGSDMFVRAKKEWKKRQDEKKANQKSISGDKA